MRVAMSSQDRRRSAHRGVPPAVFGGYRARPQDQGDWQAAYPHPRDCWSQRLGSQLDRLRTRPNPLPEGEGVRAPISIFPPNGGREGSPLPLGPPGIRPPYRVRGRLFAGTTGCGRCVRGVTLTGSRLSPSPVKGEGVRARLSRSLFSCVHHQRSRPGRRSIPRGASGRGCVESMGAKPSQGSGSCQCCSSLSLILRSAG